MTENMSYPPAPHYLPPPPNYYSAPHVAHSQPHVVSPPLRQETAQQRKRPKYTRSKTGCLTCRVKKIKCDETKPNCMRCTHGQRDCTWPEGVPTRKKLTIRKDSVDGRPSTAGSSISDGSTPPTRDRTPPSRLQPHDLGLPPLASRRPSEPYLQLHPIPAEPVGLRRHGSDRFAYSHPSNSSSSSALVNPLPDPAAYAQTRYDHSYPNSSHTSSARPNYSPGIRPLEHLSPVGQWHAPPPLLAPGGNVEPYYQHLPSRNMMGHGSPNEQHHRYQ